MEVKVPCPLFEVEVNVCPVPSLLLLELELADDCSAKATKSSELELAQFRENAP